jgi:protein farnesyltransferase subunit beta
MGAGPSRADELCYCDDGVATVSSGMQEKTEALCAQFNTRVAEMPARVVAELEEQGFLDEEGRVLLLRDKTVAYLRKSLSEPLHSGYVSLDASRPWLVYWMLHALELLGAFPGDLVPRLRAALLQCRTASGEGFGGGLDQVGHTAPTYAAVLAICTLGDTESLALVDRHATYRFFMGLKDPCGGFRVQRDGEMDTRGLYTVLAVASILGVLTEELTRGCAEFVGRCQTLEGGFGGEPGNEAHGGYAFCAFASLCILGRFDTIDVDALVDWVALRQMRFEGGFQGRANKLVDACYSFWNGALPVLLRNYQGRAAPEQPATTSSSSAAAAATAEGPEQQHQQLLADELDAGSTVMAQLRLQQYILLCCQCKEGGLVDKPRKNRDHYHTCYALSGLSVAQDGGNVVFGAPANKLRDTDPVYNVQRDKLQRAMAHFQARAAKEPPLGSELVVAPPRAPLRA